MRESSCLNQARKAPLSQSCWPNKSTLTYELVVFVVAAVASIPSLTEPKSWKAGIEFPTVRLEQPEKERANFNWLPTIQLERQSR